ncbi:MAG: glycoside hydrolase family 92 protein [Candidatus Hydrogenedentes bacterium]|nr:glycoside hydrolase family 92 protein [Candidatus Hydrogenedentota bacterium]
MKRFFKWVGIILGIPLAILIVGLLAFYNYYHHIVSAKPGNLAVKAAPGKMGELVDPFIATGGFSWMCGHDTPAATTPFGMVRLGPDTRSILLNETGNNRSGYFYGDNKIIGFSHTRLVGADAFEGGCFRVFPTIEPRAEWARGKDRFAAFSHKDELAFPGYYGVQLPKDQILVELTATPHVGLHRCTFQKDAAPHLIMDVTSVFEKKRCEDGAVTVLPAAKELEGKVRTFGTFSGRYGGLDVYFVARFNRPFAAHGTWTGKDFKPGASDAFGNDIGVDLTFANEGVGQTVEMRLALSCVSIENARKNLEAEVGERPFDDVLPTTKAAWEKRLSLIRVRGGTDRERRIFYTSLYHAFQMPTVFTDVNGEYMGFDRAVHKADGFVYYTDFSLWDSFRTVHPLYNLIARAEQRDMMVSLVEMAKAGGCLPRWPSGCGYTNCMLGTPADIAVSEAYQKGIRDFDVETAYQAMRQTGLTGKPPTSKFAGRDGLDAYLKHGYCPSDVTRRSAAATLEYAYEDYAISLLAAALKKGSDATLFANHAAAYRNVWNPESQHFEPKDSAGNFPKDRNPLVLTYTDFNEKYSTGYVEGSGEQWRWAVPFDAPGLIALFKSPAYFVSELEKYFEKSNRTLGWWNPGPYYWHGNEPYIHAAYLFNAAGRSDLTQKWVRWILETKYSDDYVGLDGNDDGGTLSAWYVFSALGFYPIAGTTWYQLGSPLFDNAEIQIGDAVLKVIAEDNSPANVYVQKVTLNGAVLDRTAFTHDEIAKGGELIFKMGPKPAGR